MVLPGHYDLLSYLLDLSVSQSGRLYHCTHKGDCAAPEPTVARPRYYLEGRRPSKTTRLARLQSKIGNGALEICKGGISPASTLQPGLQPYRLPPILRIQFPRATQSYSKGI
jgi:hypothetical protein